MYVALNKACSLMISVHIRDCMGSVDRPRTIFELVIFMALIFDGINRTKWRLFDKTYMKRFAEMTS